MGQVFLTSLAAEAKVAFVFALMRFQDDFLTAFISRPNSPRNSVPVVQATNEKTLAFLKQNNIAVCAASPAADLNYSYADFRKSIAITVGSEEEGLSNFWLKAADETVKIPMYGKVDSLNLSVSTAILVYEALRQRNLFSLGVQK